MQQGCGGTDMNVTYYAWSAQYCQSCWPEMFVPFYAQQSLFVRSCVHCRHYDGLIGPALYYDIDPYLRDHVDFREIFNVLIPGYAICGVPNGRTDKVTSQQRAIDVEQLHPATAI